MKTIPFDSAEYLYNDEDISSFMEEAKKLMESAPPGFLVRVLCAAVRAKARNMNTFH